MEINNASKSPVELLMSLAAKAKKMIIIDPVKGKTVDILLTKKHLIVYSHTKGNHWNISGNHYWYFHDITSGEFVGPHIPQPRREDILSKERLLKPQYKKIEEIVKYRAI